MEVLVYLLADPQSYSPETGPHGETRILLGRRYTYDEDEEHLQLFSDILLDRKRGRGGLGPLIASYCNNNNSICRRNFRGTTQKPAI